MPAIFTRLALVAATAVLVSLGLSGAPADGAGYHDLRPLAGTGRAQESPEVELPPGAKEQRQPPRGRLAKSDTDAETRAPRTLRVGPSREFKKPSEAFAAARSGDTIEIDAGEYLNDAACISGLSNLTVRGVGGYAHIRMAPGPGEASPIQCDSRNRTLTHRGGRATWGFDRVENILLERLEFSGAASSSGNSAGVRIVRASGDFIVRDVRLHHNQNGLITSSNRDLSLTMDGVVLDQNGRIKGGGREHNVYVGRIARFTLRNSFSQRSLGGQLVKSRAYENYILYNRLTDEAPVDSNYQLELDGLGKAYVIGNVLRKRPGSTNCCTLFHMNVDSRREHELYVVNNTFIYEADPGRDGRRFIRLLNPREKPLKVVLRNNLFVSEENVQLVYTPQQGMELDQVANLHVPLSTDLFVGLAEGDLHLRAHAAAINGGVSPGSVNGVPLMPTQEYKHVAGSAPRKVSGPLIDIGAYEFTGKPDREFPLPLLHVKVRNTLVDTSSEIEWASNAQDCVASGGWSGARPVSGSANTGPIAEPTPFTLTCTGPGGKVQETVMVQPPPSVEIEIGAVFDPVPVGSSSTVHWSARYATACRGLRGVEGPQPVTGAFNTGPLQQNTVYTIACTGLKGETVDKSVAVRVAGAPPDLPGPMQPRFHLAVEKAEFSDGSIDGSVITPTKGPIGVLRLRGKGKAGIEPTPDGDGIWLSYGGAGGQQNVDTGYLEFVLQKQQARDLFSAAGGEVHARVVPRFAFGERSHGIPASNGGHRIGHIISVFNGLEDVNLELAFEIWNGGKLHFYFQVPGSQPRTFIMSPEAGAALLAKDSPLDIRLIWDGASSYLMLNGALAGEWAYDPRPVEWGEAVEVNIGAERNKAYGPGWKILHDTLTDLRISTLSGE